MWSAESFVRLGCSGESRHKGLAVRGAVVIRLRARCGTPSSRPYWGGARFAGGAKLLGGWGATPVHARSFPRSLRLFDRPALNAAAQSSRPEAEPATHRPARSAGLDLFLGHFGTHGGNGWQSGFFLVLLVKA